MPDSLYGENFQGIYGGASPAHPSPANWRALPIYFLMVDRFNDPRRPPAHVPLDDPSFAGILVDPERSRGGGGRKLRQAVRAIALRRGRLDMNPLGRPLRVLYSNIEPRPPAPVVVEQVDATSVEEVDGSTSRGALNAIRLDLCAGEVVMLS